MIKIKELEVEYKKKKVLKAVDLEVGIGVYGLLGPNGAGKTTLMRCITGILKPSSGEIICMEKIGYLPQKFGFYKQMTVFETLKFFATLKKVDELKQKEHIMGCLKLVHLEERANDKMGTLSGGMVRRVGIAQALLGNPQIMIFDEPTAGLDPEERFRFRQLIRQIREGKCIIISTHIVEDVEASCDKIILLKNGQVLGTYDTEDFCNHSTSKSVEEGYMEHILGRK